MDYSDAFGGAGDRDRHAMATATRSQSQALLEDDEPLETDRLLPDNTESNDDDESAGKNASLLPTDASILNLVIYVLSTLFTVSFLVFLNASQAFVLSTIIQVPNQELGHVSGTLGFADQLVALPATYLWGALSDRFIPRRIVFGLGFFVISVALFLYPNVPSAYPGLLLVRCFFAIGAAACTAMMTACLGDYALPHARGRLAGLVGLSTGCGALLSIMLFLRLPTWTGGEDSVSGIKVAYYIVATTSAVWASLALVGLRPGLTLATIPSILRTGREDYEREEVVTGTALDREIEFGEPAADESDPLLRGVSGRVVRRSHDVLDSADVLASGLERDAASIAGSEVKVPVSHSALPFWKSLWNGIKAAKDPRVLLGYMGAVCARGDTIALTLFLPLFFAHYYFSSGLCPKPRWEPEDPADLKQLCKDAYLKASAAAGVAQTAALAASLFWGFLADKVDKAWVLPISAAIGVAGYGGMVTTVNPLKPIIYLWAVLLGLAESGLIVSSLALVSKVPADQRGGVAGAYSFFGAAGVLVTAKLGGYLFSTYGPGWAWAVGFVTCALCFVVGTVVVAVSPQLRKDAGEISAEHPGDGEE